MTDARRWMTRREALRTIAVTAAGLGASLLAACAPSAPVPAAPATTPPASGQAAPAATSAPAPTAAGAAKPGAVAPAATTAPTAPAATSAPAVAAKPSGVQGGKLVIGQEADPVSLDVSKVPNFSSVQAIEHIYESLATFDENMKVQPALAESWEIPDPTTYIFHLRKGVKWHNGREFVASDVAYWYQRMMDPATAAPYKSSFAPIAKVDIVDQYTVKMTSSKPYASLLDVLASLRGSAIPNKETVEQYGDLATHAVGTGPYKLAEYVPGDFVRYTRNPDYWDKGLPYIDEIILKLMVDEDQRIAALRAGPDSHGLAQRDRCQRIANETSFSVVRSPKAAEEHILINSQKKPFDDVRVRKAISMSLDRNAFITKAVQGAGTLPGPIPTGFGDWFIPPEQLPYKQDIEGAKKLLAEAGVGSGFTATIKATATFPEMSANAIELKNQLQAVGIQVNIAQMEWGELLKDHRRRQPPTRSLTTISARPPTASSPIRTATSVTSSRSVTSSFGPATRRRRRPRSSRRSTRLRWSWITPSVANCTRTPR